MTKEPKPDGVASSPFPLPDAARVLRTLWNSLSVELPRGTRESMRKQLNGNRPLGDATLRPMLRVVAEAGYLPCNGEALLLLLERGLATAVAEWDHLVGHVRAFSSSLDSGEYAKRYLRFAAIDFAIRVAALDVLLAAPPAPQALSDGGTSIPAWGRPNGVRDLLRGLPKRLGTTRSALIGKPFDELLEGRNRPSIEKVAAFAKRVAAHTNSGAPEPVHRLHLAWLFALDSLCAELAGILGRDAVEDTASGFRRLRAQVMQVLRAASIRMGDDKEQSLRECLEQLVIHGAKANVNLIDRLVRDEAQLDQVLAYLRNSATNVGEQARHGLPRSTWEADIRACHSPWILPALFGFTSGALPPMEDVPVETLVRIVQVMADASNPRALVELCAAEPAAFYCVARMVVQQSFVRGNFETVLPIVRLFASHVPTPESYLEAAIVHVAAGRSEDALRLLAEVERDGRLAAIAAPLIAVTQSLSGAHVEALSRLEGLGSDDTLEYARGVSLRGVGRIEDALAIFAALLQKQPGHVLASEQAALCCYDLADASHGATRASWSVEGNRHAKKARQGGRVVTRQGVRRSRITTPGN